MIRLRALAVVALAALSLIAFIYWRECIFKPARFAEADRCLAPVFKKHGLGEKTVIGHYSVKRRSGGKAYYHTEAEYEAPAAFSWDDFLADVKAALKPTPFRVTKAEALMRKMRQVYSATVSRDGVSAIDLRVYGRIAPPPPPPKPAKKAERPRIAIVVDDFGYNMNNVKAFFDINEPITLSILPQQPHSREISRMARSRGYEVILHLPLESWRSDVREEAQTIRPGMSEEEIGRRISKELADVPGADGVSNHMGSKATEDKALMASVLMFLKRSNLYYFDSLTSPRSVCGQVASGVGVRCGRRDRFLDNSNDIASIEDELLQLRDIAFQRGSAIAVCHDRANTVAALARMMPEMSRDGIEFVYLSELIK